LVTAPSRRSSGSWRPFPGGPRDGPCAPPTAGGVSATEKVDGAANAAHIGSMSHTPKIKPAKRCPDCGAPIAGPKLYCAASCRTAFHNRMSKRGRVALPIALGWRAGRGTGDTSKNAFVELCRYLDKCNAEDRADARLSGGNRDVPRRGALA
jgi:predicted nucleic acid-binding Zn ribbon protein